MQRKECTLLLLRAADPSTGADSLLLGEKKRGFGQGKLNGFGGKLDPGETLLAGALREMEEESGVAIPPASARHVGHLTFTFEGRAGEELHVHVCAARPPFGGAPTETEEMVPQWAPIAALPFDRMWPDDAHWMAQKWVGGLCGCRSAGVCRRKRTTMCTWQFLPSAAAG